MRRAVRAVSALDPPGSVYAERWYGALYAPYRAKAINLQRLLCVVTVMCVLAAVSGCGNEDDWQDDGSSAANVTGRPQHESLSQSDATEYLPVTDRTPPAKWLASLEQRDKHQSDPARIRAFDAVLNRLDTRFYEDARMIGNRTAQLRNMLREEGITAEFMDILNGLERVSRVGEVKSYGELCAHYFNTRVSGRSHAETVLALLKLHVGGN